MDIRSILFDVNGTLIQISTEDDMDQVFRSAAHFLTYQGIHLCREQVRDLYFQIMKNQRRASPERYPEFDAVGIWRTIIDQHMTDFTRTLSAAKLEQMPLFLAEMSRGISRHRLRLYPHVREVLDILRERYPLAVVTDAQSAYARGELHRAACSATSTPSSSPATMAIANPTGASSSAPWTRLACPPRTRSTSATTCTATSTEPARPA